MIGKNDEICYFLIFFRKNQIKVLQKYLSLEYYYVNYS